MKNVGLSIFTLLTIISFIACAPEIVTPIQSEVVTVEVDTIITFDAETFEETMEIVKTKTISRTEQQEIAELGENETYQIDTIITFNPDTYEETIEIVKTKIKSINSNN